MKTTSNTNKEIFSCQRPVPGWRAVSAGWILVRLLRALCASSQAAKN